MGGDGSLPSPLLLYRAAALADRTGNGVVLEVDGIEFSLYTLACPGLPFGVSAGVCNCLCFAGDTPSPETILPSCCDGDGVELDSGLLLLIEDIEPEGVMYKEPRARVRLPSIF